MSSFVGTHSGRSAQHDSRSRRMHASPSRARHGKFRALSTSGSGQSGCAPTPRFRFDPCDRNPSLRTQARKSLLRSRATCCKVNRRCRSSQRRLAISAETSPRPDTASRSESWHAPRASKIAQLRSQTAVQDNSLGRASDAPNGAPHGRRTIAHFCVLSQDREHRCTLPRAHRRAF